MLQKRKILKYDQKSRNKNTPCPLLGNLGKIHLVGKISLGLRRQQHERNTFLLSETLETMGDNSEIQQDGQALPVTTQQNSIKAKEPEFGNQVDLGIMFLLWVVNLAPRHTNCMTWGE